MSTIVTDSEIKILEEMYGGDAKRDASSKIRGFIFQDLLAIEYLLNDKVECICSEYLEDVDAFFYDGRLEIVQAKYYPNTSPKMGEIETDLYYQYLRLELLKSKFEVTPLLAIYREQDVSGLSFQELKGKINPPQDRINVDFDKLEDWMETKVYVLDKSGQKKTLFTSLSSDSSIQKFVEVFKVEKKKSLKEYQEDIENKLLAEFAGTFFHVGDEKKKKILLGLAIECIQKRYKLVSHDFDVIRINREKFCQEMKSTLQAFSDEHVSAYLKGIAAQVFREIAEENDDMSEKQKNVLSRIFSNTLDWLGGIGGSVSGQLQILNTLSDMSLENVLEYQNKDTLERLIAIAECYHPIRHFLKFFWKIIYDICLEKEEINFISDNRMMNPEEYISSEESRYICLSFPDKYVKTSAILYADPGEPVGSRKRLCKRMIEFKPKKWFLKGNKAGKFDYDYSTAEIISGDLVTDVGEKSFKIECLQCIKVDYGEWVYAEKCKDCIFSTTCVGGKE